jgi:hypothetical protein
MAAASVAATTSPLNLNKNAHAFLLLTRNSRRAARDALHVKHKTQKN